MASNSFRDGANWSKSTDCTTIARLCVAMALTSPFVPNPAGVPPAVVQVFYPGGWARTPGPVI